MATRKPARFKALPAHAAALARGSGSGKLLYLDAPSGLAGDMLVAALIDLGVPEQVIMQGLAGLGVTGYTAGITSVVRSGLAAKHFAVTLQKPQRSRDHAQIAALIGRASSLTDGARAIALDAFERLAAAEARIHGTTLDDVHFHEVGAVDSIVDIVAAAIAFDYLGARVVCSPLPLGRGTTRSAHGTIPLPAPATVLCLENAPTYDAGIEAELVTPTGACLVASVAREFGGWPAMRPERSGFGAGTRQLRDRPNVLRVVLGTPEPAAPSGQRGSHVIIEANVDDMSAEIAAHALARAFDAGAVDAWSTPIGMKKSRPGWTLHALAPIAARDAVARALLAETTSFGVRYHAVDRIERPRRTQSVTTRYGEIAIKIADGDGLPETAAPEHQSCLQAARAHAVPIREVYGAALAAYAGLPRRGPNPKQPKKPRRPR